MADQKINELPTKTAPSTGDKMLMIGSAEEYQIDYDQLASAILDKLATKQYSELDTTAKTVLGALDELNGKNVEYSIIRILTTSGKITVINSDSANVISGKFPENKESYIPVVVGHSSTNDCIDFVSVDSSKGWYVYSTVSQYIRIIFYDVEKIISAKTE